jgi:dienelactone hydrolase
MCAVAAAAAGGAAHRQPGESPASEVGLERLAWPGGLVYRIGPADGPAVVLLHELPGLTPADILLARRLARQALNVHVPLLFGSFGQDAGLAGFHQACRPGRFECSRLSTRSPILDRLEAVCDRAARESGAPIGVIGMCLTGILPLALLRPGVAAAVLCQPTVPFNSFTALVGHPVTRKQQSDLGLAPADMSRALASNVPFLAMRFANDKLCPTARMNQLEKLFDRRLARIDLTGAEGHSTLGSSFNQEAFTDAVTYLRARLTKASGAMPMRLATLNGRPCEIAPSGWRQT